MDEETNLLDQLQEQSRLLSEAQKQLKAVSCQYDQVETQIINCKLNIERLNEQLRVLRAAKVILGERYDSFDDDH